MKKISDENLCTFYYKIKIINTILPPFKVAKVRQCEAHMK